MDLTTISLIANGILAIVAIIAVVNQISKGARDEVLTVREHNEFKTAIERENDLIRQYEAEIRGMILDRVKILEGTRPTTGEIEARLEPIKK